MYLLLTTGYKPDYHLKPVSLWCKTLNCVWWHTEKLSRFVFMFSCFMCAVSFRSDTFTSPTCLAAAWGGGGGTQTHRGEMTWKAGGNMFTTYSGSKHSEEQLQRQADGFHSNWHWQQEVRGRSRKLKPSCTNTDGQVQDLVKLSLKSDSFFCNHHVFELLIVRNSEKTVQIPKIFSLLSSTSRKRIKSSHLKRLELLFST